MTDAICRTPNFSLNSYDEVEGFCRDQAEVAILPDRNPPPRIVWERVSPRNVFPSFGLFSCGWVTEKCFVQVGARKLSCGGDEDGDRIINVKDQCPLVPAETESGCPEGVPDCEEEEPFSGDFFMEKVNQGSEGESIGYYYPSISRCGRYVAYTNDLESLAPDGPSDIFLYDRRLRTTFRVNLGPDRIEANGRSNQPFVNATGEFVTFLSTATNLIERPTGGVPNVFLRDLRRGVTELLSAGPMGEPANADGDQTSLGNKSPVSEDGRMAAFTTGAANLLDPLSPRPGITSVLARDLVLGRNERVSILPSPYEEAMDGSDWAAIDPTGRYVAFESVIGNLPALAGLQVFIRDREAGVSEMVSVGTDGQWGNDMSEAPSVGAGGRCVAFLSFATNLVGPPGVDARSSRVFVRDRVTGTTELVSDGDGTSPGRVPSISEDCRFVVFSNGGLFVRDRLMGVTRQIDVTAEGVEGNGGPDMAVISGNGRFIVFQSNASNLVSDGTSGLDNLFIVSLEHFFGPIGR